MKASERLQARSQEVYNWILALPEERDDDFWKVLAITRHNNTRLLREAQGLPILPAHHGYGEGKDTIDEYVYETGDNCPEVGIALSQEELIADYLEYMEERN